jgi:putative transposase
MDFVNGQIYHVYNRGNKSQTLFFTPENYQFFLAKIEETIKPYASILAWCLMPNHFHWLIKVENERLERAAPRKTSPKGPKSSPVSPTYSTLNHSVAILLRVYTRMVNKEDEKTGPLFHQPTRALCLSDPQFEPDYFRNHFGIMDNDPLREEDYPSLCFQYIHSNPVTGKLVENPEDWEFSSYRDYFCGREGTLVNKALAEELAIY